MSKPFTDTLEALESVLANSGYLTGGAQIGEPKSPPADMTGALILNRFRVQAMTLGAAVEERTVTLRVYANLDHGDRERVELDLLDLYQRLKTLLDGDFDLSGFGTSEIRDVQPAGIVMRLGHQTIGDTRYRLLDMDIPVIVDDAATVAA